MPSNHQHSPTLNRSPWCKSAHAHGGMVLCAVGDATSYRTPLPPCRGRQQAPLYLGSIQGDLLGAYSNHSIYKTTEVGPLSTRGDGTPGCMVMVLQPNWVGSLRWSCDFVHRYLLVFDIAWVQYPNMLCWF